MASQVQIVNLSLVMISEETITAMSEDIKAARIATVVWDIARRETLRAHPWNFAVSRADLAQLSTAPAFEYTYQYQLPTDCLRAINLYDTSSKWEVEGRKLLCDDGTVYLRYIADVTDTAQFDALFSGALARRLAAYLAFNLSNNRTLAAEMDKAFKEAVSLARLADAQESGDQASLSAETWIDSRS